jgi:hypothetical protein
LTAASIGDLDKHASDADKDAHRRLPILVKLAPALPLFIEIRVLASGGTYRNKTP